MNAAEPQPETTATPRPRFRKRVIFILVLGFLAVAIVYPPTFQGAIRYFLLYEAYREDVKFSLGNVQGSIFEPVVIEHVDLSFSPPTGVDVDVHIDSAEASFSIANLFRNSSARFLNRLKLTGVDCSLRVIQSADDEELPEGQGKRPEKKRQSPLRFFSPTSLEAERANLTIRQGPESFQLRNVSFTFSNLGPGTIWFEEIAIYQDRIRKRFHGVTGKTFVEGSNFTVSNLVLEDDFELNILSADLGQIASGALRLKFLFNAFSGTMQGAIVTEPHRRKLNIEANGSFQQIAIAEVADFLDYPNAAGGVIKQGKFTFSGSPRNLKKATFSTWLEADEFRWGRRRWDSLRLGTTLVSRRLQVTELSLRQGENTVNLQGELLLPTGSTPWWKSDFRFDLQADITSLTELSTLLGPEFSNVYGKIAVGGSIRGSNQQFGGQLIATGSQISWRGAPLDSLHAALKINENELQITNLEFYHGDDYLRAHGVVNIIGDRQYSGELRASVDDLALYDGILQPPLVPEAPAGSLNIEWSGDGTAKAHSGAFKATFKKLRPLVTRAKKMPPVDGSLEGTYSPGNIFLNRFELAEGATALSSQLAVAPESLEFKELTLKQGGKKVLEGNAKMPIDIWTTWPEPKISGTGPAVAKLRARDLQLNELLHLWGERLPVDFKIDMAAEGEGKLSDVTLSGTVSAQRTALYSFPGGQIEGDLKLAVSGACASAQVSGTIRPTGITFQPELSLNDVLEGKTSALPLLPVIHLAPFSQWSVNIDCSTAKPIPCGDAGASLQSAVKLTGSAGNPQLIGSLLMEDMPVHSEYIKDLTLGGTFWLFPTERPAPVLDLKATGAATASPHTISIYISGPLSERQVKFVSSPALPAEAVRALALKGTAPAPEPTSAPVPAAPSPTPSPTPATSGTTAVEPGR